jgi:DNA-directed RNA polymerase specialized sigma24 family protein
MSTDLPLSSSPRRDTQKIGKITGQIIVLLGSGSDAMKSSKDTSEIQADLSKQFFETLLHQLKRCYSAAGSRVDLEEAVNSALQTTFKGMKEDRYTDLSSSEAFVRLLFRIASRNALKQMQRTRPIPESDLPSDAGTLENLVEQLDTGELGVMIEDEVQHLLTRLGENYNDFVPIAKGMLEGLSKSEIARNLGLPETTLRRKVEVVSRLFKAWGKEA